MKLDNKAELSVFEIAAMIRGRMTQDKHHFFGMSQAGQGDSEYDPMKVLGGTFPKLAEGKRIPMNKLANNPAFSPPSVTAMKLFGALPIFKKAVDQIHAKKIGVFPAVSNGGSLNAFEFQNLSIFKGEQALGDLVKTSLFGQFASLITPGHHLEEALGDLTKSIGDSMGGDAKTMINAATDTSKLMQGLAQGFGGGIQGLFDTSVFSDAVSAANDITKVLTTQYGADALLNQYQGVINQAVKDGVGQVVSNILS